MSPGWESGPPPHERGLTPEEQQLRENTDPNYEYCVIRKKFDMRKQQVWFAAHQGQVVVGRSREVTHRRTFLGSLQRFDQKVENAYYDLVITLLENGWVPAGGAKEKAPMIFKKAKRPADTDAQG